MFCEGVVVNVTKDKLGILEGRNTAGILRYNYRILESFASTGNERNTILSETWDGVGVP